MKAILLSKEDLRLAEHEATCQGFEITTKIGSYILGEHEGDLAHLGYSRSLYDLILECREDQLESEMEKIRLDLDEFSVRKQGRSDISERDLADLVWNAADEPKVNLKAPKDRIEFHFAEGNVLVLKKLYDTDRSWKKRKAHMRPEMHPTSLHPRLARACVNIISKDKTTILDPFCGSGGILIEAGLLGHDIIGYDADRIMLRRARINLDHYGVQGILEKKDSSTCEHQHHIVTDLPYGLHSKKTDKLEKLYKNFLRNIRKRSVVMFPSIIDHDRLVSSTDLRKREEFMVHLTRKLKKIICVLEPQN